MNIDREFFLQKVKESDSKTSLARKIGFDYYNGTVGRTINRLIKEMGADVSHFDGGASKRRKYKLIKKKCPICLNIFEAKEGAPREKSVCSRACSNTYFRSGPNNPNWKEDAYASTCFFFHEKKCVICGEDKIVEVHHYDEDHENNSPDNLVPVCPTHHKYFHSRYRSLVENKIKDYRDRWLNDNSEVGI